MSEQQEETVQQELQDYLSEHRANHLFIKIVEALLMSKPANPIEFVVKYLQTNYPKETANVTPKDSANIGQAAGSSTAKTEDDGEEDDEEDEEDDDDYVDELPAMRKASTVRGRRTFG